MVVVRVRLGFLRSTTHWGSSASAVVIIPAVLVLGDPPLSSTRRLGWLLHARFGRCHRVAAFCQAGSRVGQLGPSGDWARNTTDTAPDAREHASKLAFYAGLSSRARDERLCALDSLRKWRNAALAVDLLYLEQVTALLCGWRRGLLHVPVPRRVKGTGMGRSTGIGYRWRGRRGLISCPSTDLWLWTIKWPETHPLPLGRIIGVYVAGSWG